MTSVPLSQKKKKNREITITRRICMHVDRTAHSDNIKDSVDFQILRCNARRLASFNALDAPCSLRTRLEPPPLDALCARP